MPGDLALNAARQSLYEIAAPSGNVEIVEHIGTMLLDLRAQDLGGGGPWIHAVFAGPDPLNFDIVAIGQEGPLGALFDRQEDVNRAFPELQERVHLSRKCRLPAGYLMNFRAQRRIVSAILKEPHENGLCGCRTPRQGTSRSSK